ncbi:DUF3977 family protein [Paenibacillus segetis]|uniref:DUF3977 domain-containing protein n=1 Tax=Paenibacillus segetis TaxID=1325360 RepID=A0ABQ1YK34_9BACL|nr:DUF3977 family protein [Paenibacillus segetis]GGH27072.1 hypothetical protein GCM10008013_28300 [Paenibacillus segetis]
MKKYIEIGFGNTWFVRTELEYPDGTETEVQGIYRPFKIQSIYMRTWIGYKVFILDLRTGFKIQTKTRRCFKCIIGFSGI